MPRIPQDEIDRIKREVPILELVEARGVSLKRHGKDWVGSCPFHDDRTPSLVVSPSKNVWHCLGACETGGTVIDWVQKSQGVSFRHAVEILRTDPVALERTRASARPVAKTSVMKLDSPVDRDAGDEQVLVQVVDYYHQVLKESPEALAYIEARGIGAPGVVERFRLGYANRTLGYRLPLRNREAGALLRGRLQRLGMLRASGHEHFNGCLVIPVVDEAGRVVEVYGRKIKDDTSRQGPLHLYLPGAHRGVWNHEMLAASDEVILCESLIDALTFWSAGYRNVTASYGAGGFTADHREAFRRHRVRRVLIAYDRDDAGDRGARAVARTLTADGIDCYRIRFPRGMDANAYALKVQPAAKSLGVAIRSAIWLGRSTPAGSPGSESPDRAGEPPVDGETATEGKESVPDPTRPESAAPPLAASSPGSSSSVASGSPAAGDSAGPGGAPVAAPEPDPPAGASPVRPERRVEGACEERGADLVFRFEDRSYRVRGLGSSPGDHPLRVNLRVTRDRGPDAGPADPAGFHVDTLDLYSSLKRSAFIREASHDLKVAPEAVRVDLGRILFRLEEILEERTGPGSAPDGAGAGSPVEIPEEARREALAFLEDPRLLDRILEDFDRCGIVGERTNKLMGYIASISRKLEDPLAVIIQSSSSAGKSSLMEAILALCPAEDRVKYSAMTGQSLFYMSDKDLKHKILAIVEEEGAQKASYALKILQSEKELTIASTGKDPTTGKLVTHEYRVEGPVMIFLTTTAIEIDEELLNRCLVLTVNEGRDQTVSIHQLQRESQTLAGLLARRDRERILERHQNAQRLLRPLLVANPLAPSLTFLSDRTRTRRDHMKYLTLIRAVTLLHQHQRPVKTVVHEGEVLEYVEVTVEDIRVANRLAHEVLGRSLDELPPQTRRLLELIHEMVQATGLRLALEPAEVRFTRRELRAFTSWGDTQLKVHIRRLEELEYLAATRGPSDLRLSYELLYQGEGQDGRPFLAGLKDPEERTGDPVARDSAVAGEAVTPPGGSEGRDRSGVNGHRSGMFEDWSGSGRDVVTARSVPGRAVIDPAPAAPDQDLAASSGATPGNALKDRRGLTPGRSGASHPPRTPGGTSPAASGSVLPGAKPGEGEERADP